MRSRVVKLIGALGLMATLFFAAPQLAQAQQRPEVTEAKPRVRTPPAPEDLALPAPTRPGETLYDRGGGRFELGGAGVDAGVDAAAGSDAGADGGTGPPRPAPPPDDASCSAGGSGGSSLLLFLFAAGLWGYRER